MSQIPRPESDQWSEVRAQRDPSLTEVEGPDENAKLTDCYYEKKDWRLCKEEVSTALVNSERAHLTGSMADGDVSSVLEAE